MWDKLRASRKNTVAASAMAAVALLSTVSCESAPSETASSTRVSSTQPSAPASSTSGESSTGAFATQADSHFSGGCKTFVVYAQNRWQPYGTAVRKAPSTAAQAVDPGFAPNEVIDVNGWVHTGTSIYPTNQPPFNNDVMYHLAYPFHGVLGGWVSFAGVRAVPTAEDPTGLSPDGGQPAPLNPDCEGTYAP